MPSDRDKIISLYSSGMEDGRADRSRSTGLEFHYTEKFLRPLLFPQARVVELGCGTGYYGFRFAGSCAEYVGVDLTPKNIELFREKIAASGLKNLYAEMGDAADLSGMAAGSFDVVFCLGPMYHLARWERTHVFRECRRIAKDGAAVVFSYINRLGVYAGACANWPSVYPNRKTNEAVLVHGTDDDRPDVFYYTSPAEMASDAAAHGLTAVRHYGLDFFFEACAVDGMTDEQFSCYRELSDRMCEDPFSVGLANHALLVCRKAEEMA